MPRANLGRRLTSRRLQQHLARLRHPHPRLLGPGHTNRHKPRSPSARRSVPRRRREPAKDEAPAAAPVKPDATSTLDLKSLEARLKATQAIGVFTKLALKNQVDALLDQFRAYYQGRVKMTLPQLRRSYDLLVLKVLALLQDADPPLASAIASSRESIWGILSNPVKFAAV